MKELYADFNNFSSEGTLPLTCNGSLATIAALAERLVEGEEVWLSDGEIRVRARVYRAVAWFGEYWDARSVDWTFEDVAPSRGERRSGLISEGGLVSYPRGGDLAWLAVDRDGHIGVFTTGGEGPIPTKLVECPELLSVENELGTLPEIADAAVDVELPTPDACVSFARRGLVAFDWSDVHRAAKELLGAYERMALPSIALRRNELAPALESVLIELREISFFACKVVDVRTYVDCIDSDASRS